VVCAVRKHDAVTAGRLDRIDLDEIAAVTDADLVRGEVRGRDARRDRREGRNPLEDGARMRA
jgi:hypothetical protein